MTRAIPPGPEIRFMGLTTRHLVPGTATGGTLALLEHELAPRSLGSPLHTHRHEDEVSHVVSGRLGVQVGDAVLELGPGETVAKPRGTAHAFWNPGDVPARFLEVVTPAGFEAYFAEVEPLLAGPGAPDLIAVGALMARYGLEVDPFSIGALVVAHDLVMPLPGG